MAVKKFELDRVLGYRREMENIRKLEFAASKRNLEQANDALRREEEQAFELSEEFRCRQQELDSIDELRMYADCFQRKREEIKNRKELIIQLDMVMNEHRGYLLEASKDKKVLESLKEKNIREFRSYLERKDRKFLDEISIQKRVEPA